MADVRDPLGPAAMPRAAILPDKAWTRLRVTAGSCGLVAILVAHWRQAPRHVAQWLAVLFVALSSVLGCGGWQPGRGSLPEISGGLPIAVLPFANRTGSSLRVLPPKFMRDVPGALIDPYAAQGQSQTVPLLLQQRAVVELARRGYAVVPPEEVAAALPQPPEDVLEAARVAKRHGFDGPVLTGTLRRFHVTETRLLQVWLDLALVDPAEPRVLWRGSARRPVRIAPAQTWQEILLDAGGPIFADAFGDR